MLFLTPLTLCSPYASVILGVCGAVWDSMEAMECRPAVAQFCSRHVSNGCSACNPMFAKFFHVRLNDGINNKKTAFCFIILLLVDLLQ
jgi:hypothetical protein